MNTENNKIIAEFMGCFQDKFGFWGFKNTKEYKRWHTDRFADTLPYISDWNLLMEVVEKIFKTAEDEKIEDEATCKELLQVIKEAFYAPQKENVYNCCLDFIIWYNEQNSTK